ncbi:MAG: ricin-type beta-trefoil lectin domain protein [Atopobiaceae bacterium]|nr:ricin-type beta-trefoil lectin domain protein [Atopobiaceae bacterium]
MRCNEIAAAIHKRMCEDSRFGYSWDERWGYYWNVWTIGGRDYVVYAGDYDCSSSTITAWKKAIEGTAYEGKLDNATYTGNMRSVFVNSGLFEWKPMSFIASPGDLYLNEGSHVAMCQTQEPDVLSEFSINEHGDVYGGQRGDQTGWESRLNGYYDYPWDGILHYNGKADAPSKSWPLITWPSNGGNNQRFTLEKKGDYYLIRCKADKRVLDVSDNKLGGDVILYEAHGGANQLWKLVKVDDYGMFEIQSKLNANYVLDAKDNASKDGGGLCCWKRNNGVNQRWHLMANGDGTYTIVSNMKRKLVLDSKDGGK